jgi:predicted dehydrogenase
MEKVKIGLFGTGHMGKIHLQLLRQIPSFIIMGFYDPDAETSRMVSEKFGIRSFSTPEALIDICDAVDIVAPTRAHYALALAALKKGCHIFAEKPLAANVQEARELVKMVEEAGVVGMVGHVERYNPAYQAVQHIPLNPLFIEVHRLAHFNPRGADVSVVLDLMIHDLDIILSLVKGNVRNVSASGVAILTDSADIANVRIEFDNGCVANLTASRISLKVMRKMRLFQGGAYISLDFQEKKAEVVRISREPVDAPSVNPMEIDTQQGKRYVTFEMPEVRESNAIQMELEAFSESILLRKKPPVSFRDGLQAMELADTIQEKINKQLQIQSSL